MTESGDEAFSTLVAERLALVEQRLEELAGADTPFVTEAANHIIAAGGKRFRPLLVVLASAVGNEPDVEDLVKAACVVELTHVASLYHDDVMDEADLRRGAASANARFGNSVAIMVGDYLFARASTTVATLGVEYVTLQAETFARLVQGQIAETRGPGEGEDPLQHYLQVIADKTGSLIAASAMFGGMVSGVSPEHLESLRLFGEEIGLVFQLSDDVIDITSEVTGKTPGTDLREGVETLPTLLLRRSDDPADRDLVAAIDADLSDDAELAAVLERLRAHPVIDQARDEVRRRAEVARGHLAGLPEGNAKRALLKACDDIATRVA
ncbi:polyprenyl synthetase family protein [Propionibacteriaceae bacterium Y1923]|uniref:polyprenyl synthetase family protein n=1 Tax=Aestuariimicrobium sp. Y1814 TaxID=3418742 RepID=UPI003C23392B